MEKLNIDKGQSFNFGKTSEEYAKYRDIYPQELFDRLYALGVGKRGTRWLDLGTGTGVIPRGLARYGADIYATDISEEQIAQGIKLSKGFTNIKYTVSSAEDINYLENYFDVITACQCFWYFDPQVIVQKISKMLKPEGIFVKVYMGYKLDDKIAEKSHKLVEKLNSNWDGSSVSLKDLEIHYFPEPHIEKFDVDIPFTRESWHGRMTACRGTLASMDEETFKKFEKEHSKIMSKLPETFTVKHEVFITWYRLKK